MTAGTFDAAPVRLPAVGPTAAESRPRTRHWIIFTLVVVMAFFALIYSRTALDDSAFLVQQLNSQIEIEEARYWQLRLEVAELQSPERIASEASEIGLIYPEGGPIPLDVPGLVRSQSNGVEDRWVAIKALLSAQP